jgi:hypothetical protein
MLYQVEVVRSRLAVLSSLLFAVLLEIIPFSTFATGSVTLAWNKCTNSCVAGYNVYYGGASGAYTNKIRAGSATNATISGLVEGITYYFAATTYDASGTNSPFSGEVSYQVPLDNPILNCSNVYAAVVGTNLYRYKTNTLPSGRIIVRPLPSVYTNYIFAGFWIDYPPSGVWTLQSSSNLLTWSDCATGTNAAFIPKTNGNWFFRFKSS